MYIEAKETARLYKLLSDKLGSDTTEAMFKYIDNKTERSVEATIKTLATKDDLINLRKDLGDDITKLRKDMGDNIANLHKEIGEGKADTIKWMFIFWIGQVAALLGIIFLFMKK
jgi:hypothetical protein